MPSGTCICKTDGTKKKKSVNTPAVKDQVTVLLPGRLFHMCFEITWRAFIRSVLEKILQTFFYVDAKWYQKHLLFGLICRNELFSGMLNCEQNYFLFS